MTVLALIAIAIVIYGSLYPFVFVERTIIVDQIIDEVWYSVLAPWGIPDVAANLLLYIPIGLFVFWALAPRWGAIAAAIATVVFGAILSAAIETAQLFTAGRVTSLIDLSFNIAGTIAGAVVAWMLGAAPGTGRFRLAHGAVFPALMLAIWIGYRLYPFVPTLDVQRLKDGLKPLLLNPTLPPFELAREIVLWLVVARFAAAIFGRASSVPALAIVMAGVLAGGVLVVDHQLTAPLVLGAFLALVIWPFLAASRRSTPILAIALFAIVIVGGLQPFRFAPVPQAFAWNPLAGFLGGQLVTSAAVFLEKLFVYGAMAWLVIEAGMGIALAATLVATLLFVIEVIQTELPGRTPEITDPLLGLIMALAVARFRARNVTSPRSGTPTRP